MTIEKTFLDRVPKYPGRVILSPVEGKANTFDMVRADEPLTVGTPLDKATFDSIIHSRLTGRYYTPKGTRKTVSTASSTSNPIPKSWENVTSVGAVSGNYKITASGSSSTGTPEHAFDGDNATSWRHSNDVTGDTWISVDFGTGIIITGIRVYWYSQDGDRFRIKFQGSQDGAIWTDIANTTGSHSAPTVWNFENSTPYQHYRLHFNQGTVNDMRLFEWAVTSWSTATYKNEFVISEGVPPAWTAQQRIIVLIPNISTVGVTNNTLNGINVNTILQPNKRYELVYNGTAFTAKEV